MKLTGVVGSLATRVRQGSHVPVDAGLPACVVKSVEKVEEHGSNVSIVSPVHFLILVTNLLGNAAVILLLLPVVTGTPDGKGENDEGDKGSTSTGGAAKLGEIESVTENDGTNDLGKPVEKIVEGAGSGVEVRGVHSVGLVGVEDVGREKHGEEEHDPGLRVEGLPKSEELSLPRWVLHKNDLGVILADDLVGIDEEESQDGTERHESNESSVCAISDGTGVVVKILGKRNLDNHD